MVLTSINPASGAPIKSYEEHTDEEVAAALKQAQSAYLLWRGKSCQERALPIRAIGELLRAQSEAHARLIAHEMGKPLSQGRAEIEKCAWACDYYAEHAERLLAPSVIPTDATKSFVAFEPLGLVLAIMPWNYPFWQVFRAAIPALMAGNAIILKHASNVPGCALAIDALFNNAGFPAGVVRVILVGSARVGALIEHPNIRAVTFTGSTPAGRVVAAKAGAMLKKTVLELGGSDPYVVLEDADLESAAKSCVAARLMNCGQSCVAAKRLIVVEAVCRPFEELVVKEMRAQRMGDPLDDAITIGPMARHDLREILHSQVQRSIAQGARVLLGGALPPGLGAYYPPTVLTDVMSGMPVFDEETFGPVAAIIPVADEREAIRAANETNFGLGCAVFTSDRQRGERIATHELEAGCCFVNGMVRSDPRLPFGGIKESGYGRELSSFGIREFVNIKTVYVT
jgi:succinate-semialdehyde dehydrogenase/glutarate-semialdehyde dehydrogenase